MITRKGLADEIDNIDAQISALQMDKRGAYEAYREQLEKEGQAKSAIKAEVEAVKIAIRARRELVKDADVVSERTALAEEILSEIYSGTPVATRVARDARENADGLDLPECLRRA